MELRREPHVTSTTRAGCRRQDDRGSPRSR
jgi:hypothetical protein